MSKRYYIISTTVKLINIQNGRGKSVIALQVLALKESNLKCSTATSVVGLEFFTTIITMLAIHQISHGLVNSFLLEKLHQVEVLIHCAPQFLILIRKIKLYFFETKQSEGPCLSISPQVHLAGNLHPPTRKHILFLKKNCFTDKRILYECIHSEDCLYNCLDISGQKLPIIFC